MTAPLRRSALLAELAGGIRRSLITYEDGTFDNSTDVIWFQGISLYVDRRLPVARPYFGDITCLDALADVEPSRVHWLARQEGFAGRCEQADGLTTWHRAIDLQPAAKLPDVGQLYWEHDVLIEQGELVNYVERWHPPRLPPAARSFGAVLRDATGQRSAVLVRVDSRFAFARGRVMALPVGLTLLELLSSETDHDSRVAMVDCEIALGVIVDGSWRIDSSTLPYREGCDLAPDMEANSLTIADLTRAGLPTVTSWEVLVREGTWEW